MCIRDSSHTDTGTDFGEDVVADAVVKRSGVDVVCMLDPGTVSYTHLDVYKRQQYGGEAYVQRTAASGLHLPPVSSWMGQFLYGRRPEGHVGKI